MADLISPFSSDSLDLDSLKELIKTDLIDNEVITDVDYDGSNISILVQILAYLTYHINSTIALNSNQTMLLSSNIRQNIIYLSKALGYNITRPISSTMSITLSVDSLEENESIIIPYGTNFTCGDYNFVLVEDITLSSDNLSSTTSIKEGSYIDYTTDSTLRFTLSTSEDSFILNYSNIENDSVILKVKKSTDTNYSSAYTKVTSLLSLNTNKYYETVEPETEYLKIYTYFAGNGYILTSSDSVDVSFILTNGSSANGIVDCVFTDTSTFTSSLDNSKEITITINEASSGGVDVEENDSIKESAPLFYNSGNRTINKDDYNSHLEKNSLIEFANSWGGESEIPLNLGHVYLTSIPQNSNEQYLTNTEKTSILKYLTELHTLASGLILIQPKYYYMDYTIKILGDLNYISSKKEEVQKALEDYFYSNQEQFNTFYFENKIVKTLENLFDDNSSLKVQNTLRLKISSEHFDEQTTILKYYIPNSNKRYYLQKDGTTIDIPTDSHDIYSYYLDGWSKVLNNDYDYTITFSGTINSKEITLLEEDTITIDDVTYNKKDIQLDGTTIGYFNIDLSELIITEDITSDLETDGYIEVTYDDEINIEFLKSSILKLGTVTFS